MITNTDVEEFAQNLLNRVSGSHTLWLVWRDGYPGFGGDCGYLDNWLGLLRSPGATVVRANGGEFLRVRQPDPFRALTLSAP